MKWKAKKWKDKKKNTATNQQFDGKWTNRTERRKERTAMKEEEKKVLNSYTCTEIRLFSALEQTHTECKYKLYTATHIFRTQYCCCCLPRAHFHMWTFWTQTDYGFFFIVEFVRGFLVFLLLLLVVMIVIRRCCRSCESQFNSCTQSFPLAVCVRMFKKKNGQALVLAKTLPALVLSLLLLLNLCLSLSFSFALSFSGTLSF